MARAKAKPRTASRAVPATSSGAPSAGTGGSATPASVPPSNYYRPAPAGNSMAPGGTQNPANVAAPPAAPNIVQIPIQTVPASGGTSGQQLGGGAKPAGVPASGGYSNNGPGTSNTGDASVADPPASGVDYGQYP